MSSFEVIDDGGKKVSVMMLLSRIVHNADTENDEVRSNVVSRTNVTTVVSSAARLVGRRLSSNPPAHTCKDSLGRL
jgi:hypothetical protein